MKKDDKAVILLVEDNPAIQEANKRILERAGYNLMVADTLAAARAAIQETLPDAIVLDILMPDGNGRDFIAEIRKVTTAPVLLLTCLTEKDEKLQGLRAGGDDYITKPYDIDELRERVAAFLRRDALVRSSAGQDVTFGPLALNLPARRAYMAGKDLQLLGKEFDILHQLACSAGRPLSAKSLYEAAWEQPFAGGGSAVWTQISRLKRKMAENGGGIQIITLRGEGYQLEMAGP